MPDWRAILRKKLEPLPIHNGRAAEIVEELSQQLEAAYEEARAAGATGAQAIEKALEQFSDGEKLRCEIYAAVEGARLPVWQQRGMWSPRRAPIWISLALAVLFLVSPTIRQALAVIPVFGDWNLWSSAGISASQLAHIERSGDREQYEEALAFVALHDPDIAEAQGSADRAISLNPKWSWVSVRFAHSNSSEGLRAASPWVARLRTWDSGNALPLLFEAENAKNDEWRERMERAFAAPRLDSYADLQFQLDRVILEEWHPNRPDLLLLASVPVAIPDLLNIKRAADYELDDVGDVAAKSGNTQAARAAYESVARFGKILQRDSVDLIQSAGMMLTTDANRHLSSLLRSQGQDGEAAALGSEIAQMATVVRRKSESYRELQEVAARDARFVIISSMAILFSGVGSALWLVFVLWRNRGASQKSRLDAIMVLLQFAPPICVAANAILYTSYYPYGFPLSHYSSAHGLWNSYGFFWSSLANDWHLDLVTRAWLGKMYVPSIWCVAIAVIGIVALYFVSRRRSPVDSPE